MKTRKHMRSGSTFVFLAVLVSWIGTPRQVDGALIASWDFSEGAGTSAAANEAGIGDAVFGSFGSGSVPTWVSGAPIPGAIDNSALQFVRPNSGITDGGYARVTTDAVFNFDVEGDFSVAAWLKMPQPAGTTGLVNTLGTSAITGWGLVAFSNGNVQLEVAPGSGATTGKLAYNAASLMNNTEWFHLAATYQGGNTSGNSTAALTLYLNGQQVATNTVNFGGNYSSAAFPDNDLHFGAYANLTRGLQGSLDGVRIYDHVLQLADVRELIPSVWNGGAGDWHDAAKWSPSWVPGAGATATIPTGTPTISDTRSVGHVTVAGGASLRLQGGVTVTGDSLTLVGGSGATRGELRNVSGNNMWVGPIAVLPGQVIVHADGGTSLTLSGPVTLADTTHGKLLALGNGNVDISGNISGGANANDEAVATSSGFYGIMTLGGTNTYVGHTRINNGTLSVAGGSAIPDTSRVWLFNSGRLALQANETVGSLESADTTTRVTLNANTLTVGGDGTNRSFAGAISGEGGGLTKIGSGIQTLSGVNTYTGHTQINNGVISVAGGSAIPDAVRVSLTNDGTLNLQANETVGSLDSAATTTRVTLNANTLTVGGDNTNQSFAGVISGTGGLTKIGSGAQMLTGANTYEGTTTVSAGVLRIENNAALGTTAGSTTVASGASLQFSGGITVTGESLTLAGEGAGSSGALRNLSHNNEWAGPITVQAGQTGRIGVDSGSLTLSGPITFSGTQMGGFLVVHGAGVLNITGDISGGTAGGESVATSGNLSGTLNLSGANTYAGHTRINAGTLSVAGGSAIPDASRVWLFGTGKLALQANETIGSLDSDAAGSQVVLNANTLTVGGDDTNRSFAGSISGAGGVTKIGAGVQTLKGSGIAYQGNTAVSGGRLVFEDATSFGNNQPGPTTMAVSNGSTLEFKVGAGKQQNVGLAGQVTISGNGSLVKSGDGTLALGGQHSYSGDTILEGGTLTLGVAADPGVTGAALWLDASDSASLTLTGNTVAQWNDRSGNNRHAVAAGSTQPLATTSALVHDLGVVRFDGTSQWLSVDLTFLADSEYTIFAVEGHTNNRNQNYFLGTAPPETNKGLHTGYRNNTNYTLAQHANDLDHPVPGYTTQEFRVWTALLDYDFGHAIHLNGADPVANTNKVPLITAGDGRIGRGQRDQMFHGDLGEIVIFDRALTTDERQAVEGYLRGKWLNGLLPLNVLPTDTNLRIASGATLDLAGVSQTVASLADHGGGGGTVINSGISMATLNVAGSATTEFSGTLADGAAGGSLGLTHSGSGTLTLSGNNTYTGATAVLGGTLAVNGALSGTSGVAIGPDGTLGGSGAIVAAVTGAGLVSPGNSAGILAVSAIDPSDGMSFAFEFGRQGSPAYANAADSINDVLRLTDSTGPFESDLGVGNTVDVYLGVEDLAWGREFRGGFYTDRDQDFLGSIEDATFNYYIVGDGDGAYEFNGQAYYSMTESWPTWSFELATVPEFAAFAGGSAGGYVMQLTAVPEPGTLALLACGLLGLLALCGRRSRR
ncbi:MAG: autotransporter-associated beta strand repeat-containing protein [Thermoguttaceae bacterium]|jgi:autotransporter-associated beta strand protein|nr:autotransporter-associated beta strand repeat-containing protein [Thermoguttaceae bacterium]